MKIFISALLLVLHHIVCVVVAKQYNQNGTIFQTNISLIIIVSPVLELPQLALQECSWDQERRQPHKKLFQKKQ